MNEANRSAGINDRGKAEKAVNALVELMGQRTDKGKGDLFTGLLGSAGDSNSNSNSSKKPCSGLLPPGL